MHVRRCLGPADTRPTAMELLQDPFLMRRTAVPELRRQSDLEVAESRSLSREVSGQEERGEKSDGDASSSVCQVGRPVFLCLLVFQRCLVHGIWSAVCVGMRGVTRLLTFCGGCLKMGWCSWRYGRF
jgi:hypothetical protein